MRLLLMALATLFVLDTVAPAVAQQGKTCTSTCSGPPGQRTCTRTCY